MVPQPSAHAPSVRLTDAGADGGQAFPWTFQGLACDEWQKRCRKLRQRLDGAARLGADGAAASDADLPPAEEGAAAASVDPAVEIEATAPAAEEAAAAPEREDPAPAAQEVVLPERDAGSAAPPAAAGATETANATAAAALSPIVPPPFLNA